MNSNEIDGTVSWQESQRNVARLEKDVSTNGNEDKMAAVAKLTEEEEEEEEEEDGDDAPAAAWNIM